MYVKSCSRGKHTCRRTALRRPLRIVFTAVYEDRTRAPQAESFSTYRPRALLAAKSPTRTNPPHKMPCREGNVLRTSFLQAPRTSLLAEPMTSCCLRKGEVHCTKQNKVTSRHNDINITVVARRSLMYGPRRRLFLLELSSSTAYAAECPALCVSPTHLINNDAFAIESVQIYEKVVISEGGTCAEQ